MKIKAGALQYVLVISVIIAIIIFAFISLMYLQQRMTIKHQFAKQAIANTQLGFDYLKHNKLEYDKEFSLDFLENSEAKTSIIKKHWGIFDLGIITSQLKNETFKKIGLLGTQNANREALYLKDNNQSLVLVGKTKIIGTASLSKQGVKSGNIAGTSYYGNQLIYGNRKTSNATMPKIKNIEYLKNKVKNYRKDSFVNFELEDGLKLHNSFSKNTFIYEDNNPIVLTNVSLSGNIIIVSKTAIHIQSSAILEDVILMAPKITFASNTKGNFQAIASKNILVKSNCTLKYPTALVLLAKENSTIKTNPKEKEISQIKIEKNTIVKGLLVYHSEDKTTNYEPQISMEENTRVTGEVYCTKNLEILGTVFGSVYTNNFIVKKSGGVYINHIFNGEINSKELPNQYAGLQINKASNSVAKWVD